MLKTLMVLIVSVFLAQTTFSQASSGPTNSVVTKPDESSETKHLIADPLVRVLISKGILTEAEGHSIAASGKPSSKGIVWQVSCVIKAYFRPESMKHYEQSFRPELLQKSLHPPTIRRRLRLRVSLRRLHQHPL